MMQCTNEIFTLSKPLCMIIILAGNIESSNSSCTVQNPPNQCDLEIAVEYMEGINTKVIVKVDEGIGDIGASLKLLSQKIPVIHFNNKTKQVCNLFL